MTDMAVEGASVVLTASGGWMWVSGKELKIKVGKGSNRFAVDSKGILLWEHVERAVTQGVTGKPYRHVAAAAVPGTIGKMLIRAKKPSFFQCSLLRRKTSRDGRGAWRVRRDCGRPLEYTRATRRPGHRAETLRNLEN